ncbi:MAG: E3 binding domain-containing protein, partial [Phycisphaerales bacterium]|nr:E3 binding domain-containing protein [Phycisphaerales bacterium]
MSIELTMPRLSDTMESGTILKWNVKEGDAVSAGSVVADVETDKATMEMQAFDDGVLARIIVGEGQSVPVGTTIALIAEDNEDPKAVAAASVAAKPAGATAERKAASASTSRDAEVSAPATAARTEAVAAEREPATAPSEGNGDGGARLRVSPVARRLADEHGLDVNGIRGSGPNGRVVKDDVLAALQQADGVPAPARGGTVATGSDSGSAAALVPPTAALESRVAPLSSMRQTIARR